VLTSDQYDNQYPTALGGLKNKREKITGIDRYRLIDRSIELRGEQPDGGRVVAILALSHYIFSSTSEVGNIERRMTRDKSLGLLDHDDR